MPPVSPASMPTARAGYRDNASRAAHARERGAAGGPGSPRGS